MVKMQPCPPGAESLSGVKVQQQVLLKVTEPVSLESRWRPVCSSSEVARALGKAARGGRVSVSSLRTEFRDSYLTLVSTPLLECCCLVTACCTERVTSTAYHPNSLFTRQSIIATYPQCPHHRAAAPSVLPP